jgi:hypothetical protein
VARVLATRRDRAAAARRILDQRERPVLGLVLTGGQEPGASYRYYGSFADNGREASARPAPVHEPELD